MCDFKISFYRLKITVAIQSRAEYRLADGKTQVLDDSVSEVSGGFFRFLGRVAHTFISIIGVIPENTTWVRALFMAASFSFVVLFLPHHKSLTLALWYFGIGVVVYMGLLLSILRQDGLRLRLIQKWGEEKGYRIYEGILAFVFFHNGTSVGFMSESTAGSGYWGEVSPIVISSIAGSMFLFGLVVKLWSATLVGVPIYYWKDIFLGRPVSDFVVAGPYKIFTNPIYGVGHLTAYALAIYHNSLYGIIFSALNQACVFAFYFIVEKPFIARTYLSKKA